MTRNNTGIIEHNRLLQQQAETIKVTTSQFAIIIIHNLDLGLRSYALFKEEKYIYPLHIAIKQKDSILHAVEEVLKKQGYPLGEFYILRDSINSYAADNLKWLYLFQSNQMEEFRRLANMDKGYLLWLQYESFAKKVYTYEDEIVNKARSQYRKASRNNYFIQVILFFIAVPTLLITAYHATKKFAYEMQLRKAQEEKALLLSAQNEKLEQAVTERTKEIHNMNRILQQKHEEISTQNEEITAQNDELSRQREELATQNQALIESKKQQLQLYSQNLLEKSDLIQNLSDEIESLKQKSSDEEQVKNFSRVLNSTILTDEDWERFKKRFKKSIQIFLPPLGLNFLK